LAEGKEILPLSSGYKWSKCSNISEERSAFIFMVEEDGGSISEVFVGVKIHVAIFWIMAPYIW
jgi:hypothetical protein